MDTYVISRKTLLAAAASIGAAAGLRGVAGAQSATAGVAGAWKLHSFDVVEPGKPVTPRFGADPVGYLIYTPDGHVSATLSGVKRPAFSSKAIMPDAECQGQMLADFLCYAGTYTIQGDRVFHHVEVSVFTDLVGQTLERQFKIEGDTLTIRTITGGMWGTNSMLVWKRG